MRPRDWFGVAVRVLGIWMILAAVLDAVTAMTIDAGWSSSSGVTDRYYVMTAFANFTAGLVLLRGAEQIADFTYGRATDQPDRPADGAPDSSPAKPGDGLQE